MKPARKASGPFPISTPRVSVPPPYARPSCRTRSNSDARLRWPVFGNESEERGTSIVDLVIVDLADVDLPQSTAKIFPRTSEGRFSQTDRLPLRRGRGRHIDVCVRLGLGLSRRRWIHNGGVALLLFRFLPSRRRISDGSFLLCTRREQRGTCQDADVFLHSCC